jgi:hypothetical protein
MDTARVDVCYRPIRIAWAIRSGDKDAFRQAVRLNHTMWGGRFNPIVMADRPDDAKRLVELFRADLIIPVGSTPEVVSFPELFPHLITPYIPDQLFLRHSTEPTRAHILDIHNALVHWRTTGEWKSIDERGVRQFVWDADDPLADTFLVHYGDYPAAAEIGIDYLDLLCQATMAIQRRIEKAAPILIDVHDHPSLGYLSRVMACASTIPFGPAGITLVSTLAARIIWTISFASGICAPPTYRSNSLIQRMQAGMQSSNLPPSSAFWRGLRPLMNIAGSWRSGRARKKSIRRLRRSADSPDSMPSWRPILLERRSSSGADDDSGEASALGVFGRELDKPKVSFALPDKPFSADKWFYTQHLVASVTVADSEDQHTFHPPYVPEWNEFYARTMNFQYNKTRIEPERNGIVISVADHDSFLYGLPVSALVEQLFLSAGFRAKLSGGGLIARQLIARLGGLAGVRAFKIPGVRLLRTHGPRDVFTKKGALELIGQRIPTIRRQALLTINTSTSSPDRMAPTSRPLPYFPIWSRKICFASALN